MLNKAMILHELNLARIAHERWVKRAEHLISGMPIEKEFIPLEPDSCGFGKWFYGLVGQKLNAIYIFEPTMKQIETYHDKLHEIYGNIYDIFFVNPEKRSLFYKIITFNSKKVSSSDKKRADEYLIQMQETSKELLRLITKLEKAIKDADITVLQRLSNSAV